MAGQIKSDDTDLVLNAGGSGSDIKFQSNGSEVASISDGGVVTATSYAGSGANLTGISSVGGATGVDFNDNVKARFGTGNDLEIYHDGSNSYIADVGTGDLTIRAGNDLRLQDSNTQAYLTGNEGGSVEIYYNNSKKLETTSSGIDVTGSVITSDKVRIVNDTSSKIELGDSGNTSIGKIEYVHSSNDLFFKVNDAERMRIESAGNVGIGLSDPQHRLHIYHSSTGAIPTDYQMGATAPNENFQGIHNGNNSATFSGLALETRTNAASRWLIANEWQSDYSGDLVFRARDGGTTSKETMRVKSSGKVGIGTNSPSQQFHSYNTSAHRLRVANANYGIDLHQPAGASSPHINAYGTDVSIIFDVNDSEKMRVNANGAVTMPSQPAFYVGSVASQLNIALDTSVTVVMTNEIFDLGSNFASNTFTAPVTGKYQLTANMRLDSIDSAANYYSLRIVTSNRNHLSLVDPDYGADLNYAHFSLSVLADMDAGDTAYFAIVQSGGSAQSDIDGDTKYTNFSGYLVA